MNITLFGAASDIVSEVYIKSSEALGEALGRRGHALVFGGGVTGLMGAAARGIRRSGGRLIGIAPRFFDRPGVLVQDCDEFIFTDTMRQRKQLMEDRADAFAAVPGGIGTLEEFFEILTLRSLGQHQKSIALFNVNGYFDGMLAFLKTAEEQRFLSSSLWDGFGIFSDPEALVDYLERGQPQTLSGE